MTARYKSQLLIVDDDPGVRSALARFLRASGYDVAEAGDCQAAERVFASSPPDLAIVDDMLPDGSGVELLPRLRSRAPQVPILILTAHASVEKAVEAIKKGADNFLTKPLDMDALLLLLSRLLENRRNSRRQLASRARAASTIDPFAGESEEIRRFRDEAQRLLETDRPLLLLGETGTGKGVLARWLHESGPRGDESLVEVNSAGLSPELLDSELFGYEAGAFTGAVRSKLGLLEVAHRGAVFLDEIGDMAPSIQARLLKVVEEKRFRRLGDPLDRYVDVRLIAATHRDVERLMGEGRFREDLYYRIGALQLRIPPLRERREDILALAERLLSAFAAELGRRVAELSPKACAALRSHDWPGNIRELRNVIEGGLLRSATGRLEPADLRLRPTEDRPARHGFPNLEQVEREHIQKALARTGGRVSAAAQLLDVSTSSLYERIRRLAIPREDQRAAGTDGHEPAQR